jgi:hypothetical protein
MMPSFFPAATMVAAPSLVRPTRPVVESPNEASFSCKKSIVNKEAFLNGRGKCKFKSFDFEKIKEVDSFTGNGS